MVQVTHPKPKPAPRPPRIRKAGFQPILKRAAAQASGFRLKTAMGQYYACVAFVVVMAVLGAGGVWLAREVSHKGAVALAAYDYCANPPPISHPAACKTFSCLASVNDENGRYVRICHPEALRS